MLSRITRHPSRLLTQLYYLSTVYKRQLSIIELTLCAIIFLSRALDFFWNIAEFLPPIPPGSEAIPVAANQQKVAAFMYWLLASRGLPMFSLLVSETLFFIPLDATPAVLAMRIMTEFMLGKEPYRTSDTRTAPTSKKTTRIRDNVLSYLQITLDRAENTVKAAQRRAIALIFVGTLVAGSGLIFFVATLPLETEGEITPRLLYIIPRVLMLLFIQVLAGFFLRQYRNAMEEYRFFERLLRRREAEMMTYLLFRQHPDNKLKTSFLDALLRDQNIDRLGKDETTIAIETQKLSQNEFSTLVDKVVEVVKQRTS